MAIARMGYWVTEVSDPTTFWVSAELAALMDVPAGFGLVAKVRDRYHGDGAARVAQAFQRCLSDGTPYAEDVAYRLPDGRDLSLRIHGEAERDGSGAIVRVIGIVTDETRETQALKQVASSEQTLADFLDTATDWCWQTDAEHRFERFDAGSTTRSIDVRLVLGKRRWDLDVPDSARQELETLRREMEAHRPFRNLDYTVNTRAGARRVRTSGKPMFDAQGTFLGYRGTTADITELRETERLLLKRSAALAEAHRLGRMGSWSYLLGDNTLTWSDELFSVTGFDPATFDSSNEAVLALFMPEDQQKLLDVQRAVLREGGMRSCDVRLCCPDGRIRDFAVTCKSEEAGGKVVGFVGTVQDVTERKQAQRQLEELAYADSLTGLANRAVFKQSLTKHRQRPARRRVRDALPRRSRPVQGGQRRVWPCRGRRASLSCRRHPAPGVRRRRPDREAGGRRVRRADRAHPPARGCPAHRRRPDPGAVRADRPVERRGLRRRHGGRRPAA